MCYCNEGLFNEKSKKKESRRIQTVIPTKNQREKLKNKRREDEQLQGLKFMQVKHLETFKQFKRTFKKQALANKEQVKQLLQRISKANNLKQIDQISSSVSSFQLVSNYFSSCGFEGRYSSDWTPFIQGNLNCVYEDYVKSKKEERKLAICLNYYLQLINNAVSKEGLSEHQNLAANDCLRQIDCQLHEKLEELLMKVKSMSRRQDTQSTKQNDLSEEQNNLHINRMADFMPLQKELRDKMAYLEEQKQQLKNKIFQLTIELQNAKDRHKEQVENSKLRLKEQMQFAKERLKDELQYAREQKQMLRTQLEQSKGRLKVELEETKQRFKRELQQTRERLKLQHGSTKEKLSTELESNREQKICLKVEIQQYKKRLQAEEKKTYTLRQAFEEKLEQLKDENRNLQFQLVNTHELHRMELQMLIAEKEIIQKENLDHHHKEDILRNEIYQQNNHIGNLIKQIEFLQNIPSTKKLVSQSDIALKTLFNGQILSHRTAEKKFLIESIRCHMDLQFEVTEKIYDFRRDKGTDFHQFIDQHSNLILIVQTEAALFACYYSGVYNNQLLMQEEALIISLDNKKVFKLNNLKNYPNKDPNDKRAIQGMLYDDEYLIFGNNEVRIRKTENVILSYFGTTNCYFNSENYKVGDILNEGDINQVQLKNYEIHEAFLNQKSFSDDIEGFESSK